MPTISASGRVRNRPGDMPLFSATVSTATAADAHACTTDQARAARRPAYPLGDTTPYGAPGTSTTASSRFPTAAAAAPIATTQAAGSPRSTDGPSGGSP